MSMINTSVEVLETKSGLPTLAVTLNGKQQMLHSKVDPSREADTFIKQYERVESDLIIVLGLGLGYHLEKCSDLGKTNRIIVLEKISDILEFPVSPGVRALVDSGIIEVYSGLTDEEYEHLFVNRIDVLSCSSLTVLRHPPSYRIFNGYYSKIEDMIKRHLEKGVTNAATINRFALGFFKNGLKHISRLNSYRSLCELQNYAQGLDLVLVSSSPSLSLFLDDIRRAQKSCIILAVDSAAAVLYEAGIRCDFIVSVDPQAWISEHLFNVPGSYGKIITTLSAYPHSVSRSAYLWLSSHPLAQLVDSMYPEIFPEINTHTGSVAGDALAVAGFLKPERIFITGMDFSFPYNVMYSCGTEYQNRYDFIKRNRFYPKERFNIEYVLRGKMKHGKWYSRKNFRTYKQAIESVLASEKIPLFYLREKGENYGPENIQSLDKLNIDDCGMEIETGEPEKSTASPVDARRILQTLCSPAVFNQLVEHAQVQKKYSPKLLTIINNMLISVKKRD